MILSIIVAIAKNNAIGKDNQLLWHIPEDLKYFKKLTTGHAVIMGRKTFDSIGRALPNRQNIVITRSAPQPGVEGVIYVSSLQEAISVAQGDEVFVIGGESIYRAAMPLAQRLYITHVQADFDADTFFPTIGEEWKIVEKQDTKTCEKSGLNYTFVTYEHEV